MLSTFRRVTALLVLTSVGYEFAITMPIEPSRPVIAFPVPLVCEQSLI